MSDLIFEDGERKVIPSNAMFIPRFYIMLIYGYLKDFKQKMQTAAKGDNESLTLVLRQLLDDCCRQDCAGNLWIGGFLPNFNCCLPNRLNICRIFRSDILQQIWHHTQTYPL